jgi:hypothetical protein
MSARDGSSFRATCIIGLVVCLGLAVPRDVAAQSARSMTKREARLFAKGCSRISTLTSCVKSGLDSLADLVLAELQAAPLPTERATPSEPRTPPRVVWDGTFAHPDAPNFYALKRYAAAGSASSTAGCDQLPTALKSDSQLLLRLTCEAERELTAGGPNRWPEELRELQEIRKQLGSCLPAQAASPTPCAAP